MPKYSKVIISSDLLQTILEGAKHIYPRETILLLRGVKKHDVITVTELLVPPLAGYGQGFSHFPLYMMPMDFSIVGTAHSHPSGNITPSHTDLNHFFGRVLMIVGFPFADEKNVVVYNRDGEKLTVEITNP